MIALRLVYNSQQVTEYPSQIRDLDAPDPPAKSNAKPLSAFDQIVNEVYTHDVCNKDNALEPHVPKEFNLDIWRPYQTTGGLDDNDRKMLAKYYGSANSVFEWGLGESSSMAGYFNVSRYAGVDSDAEYVSNARDKVRSCMYIRVATTQRCHPHTFFLSS